MKKITAVLICIVLLFAFTACGESSATDTSTPDSKPVPSAAQSKDDAVSSESVSSVPETKKEPVKIMPMGDSLTQGGEHDGCGAYRPALLKMLDEDGVPYQFVGTHNWSSKLVFNGQVMHSGYGGMDVFGMEKELDNMKSLDPDIILLMLGRNDASGGITGETFAQVYYDRVIAKLYEMFPDVVIYVASIPPIRVYGGGETLDMSDKAQLLSNPAIKAMVEAKKAEGKKIEFVDMSIEATGLTWEDFVTSDFVHPLAAGYEKIATQWHNAIKDKVAEISAEINK